MKRTALLTAVLAVTIGQITHAEVLMNDGFSPDAGNRTGTGVTIGASLDNTAVQTGTALTWQNEYNGTLEMNGFVYGRDSGTGRFAIPDSTKTSANNYVPFVFSNIPKILTVSAEFKAAGNKSSTGSNWSIGFWQTIDNANLANIVSNDSVSLRFFPAGTNEGKVQIRVYINGTLSAATATTTAPFAATDVIRLTLSYDMNTGETVATAYNVTADKFMTSAKLTKPDVSDLNFAGFGMVGLPVNQTDPSTVDNFKVSADHKTSQLISDNRFQAGVSVMNPTGGAVEGPLQFTTKSGPPTWTLAQWLSHASIYGTTPAILSTGAYKWSNAYKYVTISPLNTTDSDLTLYVDSIAEYGGVYRDGSTKDWPHLLVAQGITSGTGAYGDNSPALSNLSELNFNLDANLKSAYNQYTSGYNSSRHAAQFLVYFTVQNRNKLSAGYGKYIWFGLTIYDDRYPLPNLHVSNDAGTQTLIYNIGIQPFTSTGLSVGVWKNIHGDILPHIKAALQKAWDLGYLGDSHNLADYKLGGMNMGWEVPGLSRVTMQVRYFRVEAVGPFFPKDYEFNANGDKQGWTGLHLTDTNGGPLGGIWTFTASEGDPQLLGPAIRVNADRYTKVSVKMMNNGNPAGTSTAQLFWKVNGVTSFSEALSKKVTVTNDGVYAEYTFDMTNDPDWQGEITQLRLDPLGSGDGHPIAIDYIRFD